MRTAALKKILLFDISRLHSIVYYSETLLMIKKISTYPQLDCERQMCTKQNVFFLADKQCFSIEKKSLIIYCNKFVFHKMITKEKKISYWNQPGITTGTLFTYIGWLPTIFSHILCYCNNNHNHTESSSSSSIYTLLTYHYKRQFE